MKGNINWAMRSTGPMTEEEIASHCDEVDWRAISRYQKLSEDFIIRWQDRLDWHLTTLHQNLSDSVIKLVRDKLASPTLIKNIAAKRLGLTDVVEYGTVSIKQRWQVKRLANTLKRRLRIGWRPTESIGRFLVGISIVGWIYYIGAKESASKTFLTVLVVLLGIMTAIGGVLMFYRVARDNLTKG